MHGYTHEKNEFSKGYEEVKNNLEKGINIFYKAFNFYPKGFVPGYWRQNKDTIRALKELNFEYTNSKTKITYFNDKEIRAMPTCMVSSNKVLTFLTKILSGVYARIRLNKNKIIRLTIHPREIKVNTYNYNMRLLKRVLDKGYVPVTYEELKTINLYT